MNKVWWFAFGLILLALPACDFLESERPQGDGAKNGTAAPPAGIPAPLSYDANGAKLTEVELWKGVASDSLQPRVGAGFSSFDVSPQPSDWLQFDPLYGKFFSQPFSDKLVAGTTDTVPTFRVSAVSAGGAKSQTEIHFTVRQVYAARLFAGAAHACATVTYDTEGKKPAGVICWGNNRAGQLGDGTHGQPKSVPVVVKNLPQNLLYIGAGGGHTCASDGNKVWCWGANMLGQLGIGGGKSQKLPTEVTELKGGIQGLAAGFDNTCAIQNGSALCWGKNEQGELGTESTDTCQLGHESRRCQTKPKALLFGDAVAHDVAQIAVGEELSCALKGAAGEVWCWGKLYSEGEDLNGNTFTKPRRIDVGGKATAIYAGASRACATVEGQLKCWGKDLVSGENRKTPEVAKGLPAAPESVSLGVEHACATVKMPNESHDLYCWGKNVGKDDSGNEKASGKVGLKGSASVPSPTLLGRTRNTYQVAVGLQYSCAIEELPLPFSAGKGINCWGMGSDEPTWLSPWSR